MTAKDPTQEYAIGGLIGDPVRQSFSHKMFEKLGELVGCPWRHLLLRVDRHQPDGLACALKALTMFGFRGVNVTLPYKTAVMSLLDQIHEDAQAIGAVNTIHFDGETLCGYNTDWYGALSSIETELMPIDCADSVFIVGAGGAARAIAYGVHKRTKNITIFNRTYQRAADLVAHIKDPNDTHFVACAADQITEQLRNANYIVNATSLGLHEEVSPLPQLTETLSGRKDRKVFCYDAPYRPTPSQFLRDAAALGIKGADGTAWMIHQGALAFKIWTGVTVSDAHVEVLKDYLKQLYARRSAR